MTHFAKPLPRRGPARRIGRSLAFVLPVVLVLSGTLAVTRVNWSGTARESVLTASSASAPAGAAVRPVQDVLRDRLLLEVSEQDPGTALTHLQQAVHDRPSLARHCGSIARALGRAAVQAYGPNRAQAYARPVCDTSFAAGVAAQQ